MFNLMIRFVLAALLAMAGANAAADPVRDFVVAAQMDNASMVKKLLKNGATPNTVDPITGQTVLILALREGANDVIDVLLAQPGIDLERAAPNGNRALMMAAFKRNKPAVLALLAKGAIVTYPGWTALHYAAASGDDEIVRILLDHYAYIDAETPSKLTPLMIAAREGQEAAARLLMQEGADATLKNNESLTAAQIAERADKPRIADAINAHLSLSRKGL
ncbi:ankyrin repeat domain-containing protein [Massilia sp. CCM 8695]|uniref:Ankyrin repeat domain-containing protein n=1 Tax=Massilia frigida TaxID=2609281 RepID=A0ABX0NFL5_9BURK|nr:ankyrin repeat domain-containing protein [Massilia frigida]NHZ80813.1 ankyrin repeat domain-containing protein [Massilia frigida]